MFGFKTAALAAGRRFSRLFSAFFGRRVIVPLLYANERMLRDVGLSRADIVDCLSGSLCAAPSRLLIERINARCKEQHAAVATNARPTSPKTIEQRDQIAA